MGTATLCLEISGRSDPGMVRRDNEDGFLVTDLTNGGPGFRGDFGGLVIDSGNALLIVADGMGGAAAGEVASGMALDRMNDWFRETRPGSDLSTTDAETLLHQAIKLSNSAVYEKAVANPRLRGMGTTLTCSWIQGDRGCFAQIGDSRAYLVRDGELRRLTEDQSLRQHLVSIGKITAEEAETMEESNVILQALGVSASVAPVMSRLGIRPGDLLLLCSDGLNAGATDEEIARVLAGAGDLDAAADELVRVANDNGGPDNITVILARVHDADSVDVKQGRAVGSRSTAADQTQELVSLSGDMGAALAVSRQEPAPAAVALEATAGSAGSGLDAEIEQTREVIAPLSQLPDPNTAAAWYRNPMFFWGAVGAVALGGLLLAILWVLS